METQNPQQPSQNNESFQSGEITQSQGMSDDTKTLIVVLALIFAYPVGLILMYILTKWPMWVKVLISLPIVLTILGVLAVVILVALNPDAYTSASFTYNLLV